MPDDPVEPAQPPIDGSSGGVDPRYGRDRAADAAGATDPPAGPGRRRSLLGLGGAIAGGIAVIAGWQAWHLRRPSRMPEVSYPLIDGRRLGPAELAGRVVLVNFWATTCGICVAEMPDLAALYRDYRSRGLELVAIAMPYDRPDHVLHFAATRRLPFPVALDPMGAAVAAWGGVEATPASWLVAPDGTVVRRWLGRPDLPRLRGEIESLLPRGA